MMNIEYKNLNLAPNKTNANKIAC